MDKMTTMQDVSINDIIRIPSVTVNGQEIANAVVSAIDKYDKSLSIFPFSRGSMTQEVDVSRRGTTSRCS